MLNEFKALIRWVGWFCVAFIVLGALFFAVGVSFSGNVPVFTVMGPSLAVTFFQRIVHDLAPTGVVVAASSPLSPFLAQASISLFLAFAILVPVLVYAVVRYVAGALEPNERRVVYVVSFPTVLLFALGAWFSYHFVLPTTFSALYAIAEGLSVPHFFFLEQFISTTLALLMVGGILFLIPVVMPLATFLGVIDCRAWATHWRGVLIGALVFAAIITPDGSGISMLILVVPIVCGYLLGLFVSWMVGRSRHT